VRLLLLLLILLLLVLLAGVSSAQRLCLGRSSRRCHTLRPSLW
jgi:hypothetical protein